MDFKGNQDTEKDESQRFAMEDNKPKEEDTSLSEGESSSMDMHLHPIKSTAVVKYSASQSPAHFAKLQCNTDLNMPPSNWLSSSAEPYGLHYFPSHSTGFSSFKMAHMFPDCVGEVDVVSDAENIKKLLKIPYSRGPVSMMVHRIENTLLIDDFDIHKHLLITAKKEWDWLKKFFFNHVLTSLDTKEKGLFQKNKTRGAVQERSLVSKFLYHSLASDPVETPKPQSVEVNKTKYGNIKGPRESSDPGPVFTSESTPLPEPREEEAVPDAVSSHNFTRNVVWTFEDIQMLIGTDMPIFGGSTHPCISLRLREMTRPINVLTGLDYWLDNLMCNVPEVVMCYHLAGIVQRYELIKTEDLPHLPNSKFSPKLIRDVAQNILSFLKSNATKAGHTYWLFRGKDDDIVKLYDLTSLCTDILDDRGQNPFTVPVGMLLYRVARNMKNPKPNKRQQATMQTLLTNCLSLLAKEKYPKIVASAHYMLSDLYVPTQMDPESPNPGSRSGEKEDEVVINSQSDEEGPKEDEFDEQDGIVHSPVSKTQEDCAERKVAIQSLCISKRFMRGERHKRRRSAKRGAAPLTEGMSTKDRCLLALDHIAVGLSCLQYLKPTDPLNDECDSTNETRSNEPKKRFSDEEPKMARPYQPIPMPYSRLGEKTDKEPEKENRDKTADGDVKQKSGEVASEPWGDILRGLLYEKAGFVFAKLTDFENQSGNFGVSLRMVTNALQCCKVLSGLRSENLKGCGGIVKGQHRKKGDGVNGRWDDLDEIRANVLSRAGDAAFMIVKQWKELEYYKKDFFGCISESEAEVKGYIEDVLAQSDLKKKSNISPLVLREEWKTNSTKFLKSGGELASSFIGEEELPSFVCQSLSGSIEEMLLVSCCCYQTAFTLTRSSTHGKPGKSDSQLAADAQRDMLVQRLGNIHNELGALYNGKFQANIMQEDDASEKNASSPVQLSSLSLKELARLSSEHFDAGIKAFSFIKDRQNMALLHSNLGRLMQLQAHRCGVKARLMGLNQLDKKYSLLKQEKMFYNKAVESYQRALDVLNKREEHPEIWDAVASGLSSALFNQAIHLNDPLSKHPAKMSDDGEEVIEAFKRALKSCEVETDDIRTPFYQYRAATIHHHLAVKFYDKFRALSSNSEGLDDHFKHHKRKGGGRLDGIKARGNLSQRNLQMANQHYEKSAQLLMELEHPTEYLRVLIERIALEEFLCSTVENKQQIARHYSAVKLILGCKKILDVLIERNEGKCDDSQKIGKEPIASEGIKDSNIPSRKQSKGDGSEGGGSNKLSSTSSDSLHADNEPEVCDDLGDSVEEQVEILELLQSIKGKLQTHLLKLAQLGSSHNKELVEPVKKMYRLAIEMNLEKDDQAKKPAQKIVSLSVQLRNLILKLEEETKRTEFSCLE